MYIGHTEFHCDGGCGNVFVWESGISPADAISHAEIHGWLIQSTWKGHYCKECRKVMVMIAGPSVHPKDIGRDANWTRSRIGQERKVARNANRT